MARNMITFSMRKEIEERLKRGEESRNIAYHMNLSQSALYAELRRGRNSSGVYDAELGEKTYAANIARRGNRTKRVRAETG